MTPDPNTCDLRDTTYDTPLPVYYDRTPVGVACWLNSGPCIDPRGHCVHWGRACAKNDTVAMPVSRAAAG